MTTHELAKSLLEMEDIPVYVDGKDTCLTSTLQISTIPSSYISPLSNAEEYSVVLLHSFNYPS